MPLSCYEVFIQFSIRATIHVLLQMEEESEHNKLELLRLALARNLARAILHEGSIQADQGTAMEGYNSKLLAAT